MCNKFTDSLGTAKSRMILEVQLSPWESSGDTFSHFSSFDFDKICVAELLLESEINNNVIVIITSDSFSKVGFIFRNRRFFSERLRKSVSNVDFGASGKR